MYDVDMMFHYYFLIHKEVKIMKGNF